MKYATLAWRARPDTAKEYPCTVREEFLARRAYWDPNSRIHITCNGKHEFVDATGPKDEFMRKCSSNAWSRLVSR